MAEEHDHSFSKSRMEALTDALFATVMTILVLSLVVPVLTGPDLSSQITSAIISGLPAVFVYAASFMVLLVMWIGHNNIFRHSHDIQPRLLWLNGFLLILIGLVPFSTAFLGRYPLQQPAIFLYAINFLLLAAMFRILTGYVREHHGEKASILDATSRNNLIPVVIYVMAPIMSYVSPYISLILFAFMPVFYLFQAFGGMYWRST